MNNQVEKVLQMAMLDKKDFSLKATDINIHEIIGRAAENISLSVERKEGKVTTDLQANKSIVEGDLTHISNIVNNLLDNANKYSPEKPEINITTKNTVNRINIVISDKGKGIKKEDINEIFNKFYRVSTGDVHNVKGFGLGLYYVKQMMNKHGGDVLIESEFGKGSSFTLSFPIIKE